MQLECKMHITLDTNISIKEIRPEYSWQLLMDGLVGTVLQSMQTTTEASAAAAPLCCCGSPLLHAAPQLCLVLIMARQVSGPVFTEQGSLPTGSDGCS